MTNERTTTPDRTSSLTWLDKARDVVPAACSTLAKAPHRLLPGRGAIAAVHAKDAEFTDLDGRTWLDCEMAMGTATWGHARPEVREAVRAVLERGTAFSVADPLELELAERLLSRFGRYEAVKFAKSGADVVSGAVRIARAATGRDRVVATEYHGWHDWAAPSHYSAHPTTLGIPQAVAALTLTTPPDDSERLFALLREHPGEVAAVVVCPNRWSADRLGAVVDEARSMGTVVIFDEVTSGIRMGRRATCGEVGIWPDLLCVSKGMANGLPLAALLGDRRLVMRAEDVRMSNAHSSESLALAAALACEDLMDAVPAWPSWRTRTVDMLDALRARVTILGLGGRIEVRGDHSSFSLGTSGAPDFWTDPFRAHLLDVLTERRIFTKGYFVFSDRHTPAQLDEIERAIDAALTSYRHHN
ncbi:aminotransferase class III-fold pyridoxal phosphate-dependent enzyme [Streptomyces sp. SP18CS02]|uniref:aminotransferase class III-fold pyridoxal phosphate-dependent enzyme n=1 Tax=Streptomyces sp. SP18CS02 TaxID=3002531 RepID=UPI002E79577C|nr:aminotransferase class III-fold pyridoxal phosphate-dependent enzyme [Streptomyces sp. SP18CS02]MEE1754452.1 aminotransferase class III-fold pyridoxal phosphate-dependent enzyme [Streptomyces sp. SP18CS02]